MNPVEVTTAPWHYTTFWDWADHWQTLLAGFLAFVAGVGTVLAAIWAIWATRSTAKKQIVAAREDADRVISATRAQTDAPFKQTETTVRLERRRVVREGYAFSALLGAAISRVLDDAKEARDMVSSEQMVTRAASEAPRFFIKNAFPEVRAACVRQGGPMTQTFLDLESQIDKFARRCEDIVAEGERALGPPEARKQRHNDLLEMLGKIEISATYLRDRQTLK